MTGIYQHLIAPLHKGNDRQRPGIGGDAGDPRKVPVWAPAGPQPTMMPITLEEHFAAGDYRKPAMLSGQLYWVREQPVFYYPPRVAWVEASAVEDEIR
jgi:hypothetical protein